MILGLLKEWIWKLLGFLSSKPQPKAKSGFQFSPRSLKAMEGIHPDLRSVTVRALELTSVDFIITEGLRSRERQAELVAAGASKTMNSRHLTGHAVDYVAYHQGIVGYDVKLMTEISEAFKAASSELKIPVDWGGDWKSFKDTPHIELTRARYP